ncbi:MAG: DUF5916 domain-containing protein [Pseudomonadota bacterium]
MSALPSHGEFQYWVSVGSYQDESGAQKALTLAGEKLTEPFSVFGTQTPKGYFYRVASGPYFNREAAEAQVRQARELGFPGAWLWADRDEVFSTSEPFDTDLSSTYESDYDLGGSEDYTLPSYDELPLDDTEDSDSNLILEREIPEELVDEAPEGYKLNKLRRDARVQPPPRLQDDETPPSSITITPEAGSAIPLAKRSEQNLNMNIDGNLNEAVWGEFPGVNAFRVVDPDTGSVPRYNTLVKMFYTDRGIYIGFQNEQPPNTLVQRFSGRDEGRLNRDNVGVTLDTSGEGRYGYWVNLALGGNQTDGTVLPERQFSGDWDGAWYGGTVTTPTGWNAEILLPWSQVAMPNEAGERIIRAYASRKVAHLDERWAVPALPFTQPLFMSALQPLLLNEVNPQRQWSVFPFASVTSDQVEDFVDAKIGADIFFRPSTNFQLTATLNPDFGNVESDDVIVNLSAFETFFPEKRLFFQEGSEIFDTTPRSNSRDQPTTLVNTRRIGGRARAPDNPDDLDIPERELGQPAELLGAAKLVGSFGKVRYGIMGASEDETKFDAGPINLNQSGSDYGVARFLYEDKSDAGDYRALGVISTLVSHEIEDALVHGLDYHYLTQNGKWKVDGQFIRSDVDEVGVGYGGFADVQYTVRQGLNFRLGLSHYDDKLDFNDLGFLRRNDATNANFRVFYTRSNLPWLRKLEIDTFTQFEVNSDGDHTRRGVGGNFKFDLLSRDRFDVSLGYFPERDEDRSSRGNGTFIIEPRHRLNLTYRTDDAQRFSMRFDLGHHGEELGGTRINGRVGLNWRPYDQINVSANAEYQIRDGWLLWQEDRNFTTFETQEWRPRVNVDYFITAKQQLRFSAQWVAIRAQERNFYVVPDRVAELEQVAKPDLATDDFTISRVNMQLRYRWEIAPLSDLFVVYTLNGSDIGVDREFGGIFSDALDDPEGDQLVVKLRYRLGS